MLIHVGQVTEPGPPPDPHQTQSELEILGQGTPPPRVAGQRVEGPQPGELSVAAQTRRAEPVACDLDEPAEPDELDVLHPGQRVRLGVGDPYADLDRADSGVGEVRRHVHERLLLESPVGVDDDQHHVIGVVAGQPGIAITQPGRDQSVGVVEHLALALSRLGRNPARRPDARVPIRPGIGDGGRGVGRRVVDDEDAVLAVVAQLGQRAQRAIQHELLVAGRDEDDHQGSLVRHGRAATRQAEQEQHEVVGDDQDDHPAEHGEVDGHVGRISSGTFASRSVPDRSPSLRSAPFQWRSAFSSRSNQPSGIGCPCSAFHSESRPASSW